VAGADSIDGENQAKVAAVWVTPSRGISVRIDEIDVENFRGIKKISLKDLGSTVVIAGANGSGKSCIFDAIRLLKSAYGGYQQNEWHHWMAEFAINFANNVEAFSSFFQDRSKLLSIRCVFRLHPAERIYLQTHGEELVRQSIWRLIAPEMYGWSSYKAAPMAAQYRSREPEVAAATALQWGEMQRELSQETICGHLWAMAGSDIQFAPSKALEILFSAYEPGRLGLIDYHGAQRMYTREQVSGINLDLTAQEQQNKSHALYNYNAKYSNVKAEMAASFVKELLADKAGVKLEEQVRLSKTLDELFATFFPDKKFLGPQPTVDGALTFPVRTATGATHDLNELSAGEKEVLYGYLRIRNSAPRYSVILIDEPELHLNPRLVKGLPKFYHQHLGLALENQIWLVTHSDALLREVVGRPEYSVFHMVSATDDESADQIQKLTVAEDAERAVISLVGDLAAYRPGKNVVIFEGGGDSEFDEYLTGELFPDLIERVNVISGGNKVRVRELHSVLDAAAEKGFVPFRTFSITDRDSDHAVTISSPRFRWDVYHIENYLLEPSFVAGVLKDIKPRSRMSTEVAYDKLRKAARDTLTPLVHHELARFANATLISALDTGSNPKAADVAGTIAEAIGRSVDGILAAQSGPLSLGKFKRRERELRQKFEKDLATDAWRANFRGRDVLKRFVADNCDASYETVRNLIIARMRDAGHKPTGMQKVVDQILQT
jgi:hypothetical protein